MSTAKESLQMLFSKMEDFISTKTVVGEPVTLGDITIIPLVDISFGVATGVSTSKESENSKDQDGGAGGLGAKMTPTALLVINNGTVQLVNVKNQESTNKLIDMIPGILEKFNLFGFGKKDEEEEELEETTEALDE